jgi:transposase
VSTTADSLPNDLESLRVLAAQAIAERDVAIAEREAAVKERAKYGWHLPLYRQAKMLSMQGIDIDRSTLAFWVGYAAAELAPLYELLKQHLLSSSRLAVDETPVLVLDPGRGRTKTGYFWSVARDDRPFGGTDPPAVAYTYAPGRGAVHLHTLLTDYRGIVQCDGYAPYKKLLDDAITLAFCWAHVRRGFFEIARKGNAPIATQALLRVAALYRIEETIRGKRAERRRAVRREQSAPHCEALRRFVEKQLGRVSAKAPIAQAPRRTWADCRGRFWSRQSPRRTTIDYIEASRWRGNRRGTVVRPQPSRRAV